MTQKPGEQPPPYAPNAGYGTSQPPPTYSQTTQVQGQGNFPPNSQFAGSGYQQGYQPLPQSQPGVPCRVTNVVVVGGCPACRVGYLEDQYTLAGIFLALFFFPLGILCCLAMKVKTCRNCGASFG